MRGKGRLVTSLVEVLLQVMCAVRGSDRLSSSREVSWVTTGGSVCGREGKVGGCLCVLGAMSPVVSVVQPAGVVQVELR